ncbi:MAG: ATP-dependent zinc metalloprotease FtsH, partial [Clostridia bacterium]|nr:ATP-dependent zinc metalloprotease FtsH [Clostridia bacterium]
AELAEVVEFMRSPKRFTDMGARIPKGVLLVGPPGTGKTLLAKAVAGEAGVPFFSISGSDFVEMFVGVGASRVRDLFDQAKRSAPAIVFIDEIDAVGRHRGAGLGGGHDEREQTLNQLLVEMDGFAVNEGVIVMAATNRRDILDPALLRPGRFDRTITVNYPDLDGRVAIMKVHTKGKPLAEDVDLKVLAKRTPFATGADLENMMNEAAILAARARRKEIDQQLMLDAIARIQMGPEKRSHKVTDNDRRMVAIHEGGHAIVSHMLPEADDVHLVTIVPRGRTGGHTLSLPSTEDEFTMQNQLMAEIATLMGGHAAEKLVLGEYSVGSTSDLQRATELCRRMVTMFGMSDEIGPVYLDNDQEVFVGMEFGQSRGYSEETAARIDGEVKKLCQQCYDMAVKALTENREKLELLTEALLKHETLSRQEFVTLMETGVIPEITSANKPRSLHEILEESKAQEAAEAPAEENAAEDGNKPDEEIVKEDEA